jgi:DNA-directed RNA polymerase subunit RPC12/RpoP
MNKNNPYGIVKVDMKKRDQNVLARNSSGAIDYICGKCGKIIDKEDSVCPHCNAKLGKIRCPFCGFTGELKAFMHDTCPRCGRRRNSSGRGKAGGLFGSNGGSHSLSTRQFILLLWILAGTLVGLIWIFLVYFEFI